MNTRREDHDESACPCYTKLELACQSREALMETCGELVGVVKDLMAHASGETKSCGHEFNCICPFDSARKTLRFAEARIAHERGARDTPIPEGGLKPAEPMPPLKSPAARIHELETENRCLREKLDFLIAKRGERR